jgi:hypothetical protein
MQKEMGTDSLAAGSGLAISILGVNEEHAASASSLMWADRFLPLLQDTPEQRVWQDRWHVEYRDVVVLGTENQRLFVYNLTEHNLQVPGNYATLKAMLLAAAGRSQ